MAARTFVGFGFGPIQSALFLYEAYRSGHFSRFVIAEVDAALVQAVRSSRGRYTINIARPNRIEQATLSDVELYNPAVPEDRHQILQAIAGSDELATSLPSVAFFDKGGQTSVARALADGLSLRTTPRPTVIYAAENHNHAAELLREAVAKHCAPAALQSVQFLNTVIGKMSGVITDPATIARLDLATMTPAIPKAVLVEEFNRILISQIILPGFTRGIDVFIEKPDLLPFEEAKLYGHNAIHALIAYLAAHRGLTNMADAAAHPDIMATARAAFLDESGAALIRKHAALGDPLFTPAGYAAYADDLLARMVRPTLNDLIVRVTRDQVRKLGYDDRFYGTMRLSLQYGIRPAYLAQGAAAAVLSLLQQWDSLGQAVALLPRPAKPLSSESVSQLFRAIWSTKAGPDAATLIDLTWEALMGLKAQQELTN
jgi:mannitol-1-phosphate/altronate dehydrogenase